MAISFGRGLLALAAGGADVVNQEAEAARESAARAEELAAQSAYRRAESKYAEDLKNHSAKQIKASAYDALNPEQSEVGLNYLLSDVMKIPADRLRKMSPEQQLEMARLYRKQNDPGEIPTWDETMIQNTMQQVSGKSTSPALDKIGRKWFGTEQRLLEAKNTKTRTMQESALNSIPAELRAQIEEESKQAAIATAETQAAEVSGSPLDVRDLIPDPEDTFSTEAEDKVVRLVSQLEGIEADLAEDPNNVQLQRRKKFVQAELDQETASSGLSDAEVEQKARLRDQILGYKNTIDNSEVALETLNSFEQLVTPGGTGVAGGIRSFKASLSNTITGIAELSGFTEPKSVEEKRLELEAADLTEGDIAAMDADFLQGKSTTERINLIYALANTFKEQGRRNINNLDIENATAMIGGGAGDMTAGRIDGIRQGILRKTMSAAENGYFSSGITPRERAGFASAYMQAAIKKNPDQFMKTDPQTGKKVLMSRGEDWKIDARDGSLWIHVRNPAVRKRLGLKDDENAISFEEYTIRAGVR